jgi:hypothetical protein
MRIIWNDVVRYNDGDADDDAVIGKRLSDDEIKFDEISHNKRYVCKFDGE